MMHTIKRFKSIRWLAVVGIFSMAIGTCIGIAIIKLHDYPPKERGLEGTLRKFSDILSHIETNYIEETDLTSLTETAIAKMLTQLDPHTVYMTAQELAFDRVNEGLKGELEGIGIYFTMLKDTIYIITAISGGPSEKVGIKPGDQIIKIDGEEIVGKSIWESAKKLRGPKGTKVKVTIQRNNCKDLLEFTITRDKIPIYSVDVSYMIDAKTGYINISHFAERTYQEFNTGLAHLKRQGMKQLVIDLRGNAGGYMGPAIKIAEKMLDKGKLIVYTQGRNNKYNANFYAQGKESIEKCPVIVLIDEGSASAAEILAGALQDHDRALIVGRRSFGKGLVQNPIQLHDGSQLRLTIARYFTPSGRFIQKPYEAGVDAYHKELMNRYVRGEYFHADSIQFDNTLKYKTSKGREVYGGGGIMPDFFIPLDTTQTNEYLHQLYAKGVIREYALEYVAKHRKALHAMQYADYRDNFEVTGALLNELIHKATRAGIAYDAKAFQAIKHRIKLQLKALIARDIWSMQGYYPIYHQYDPTLKAALQRFDQAAALIQEGSMAKDKG